MHNAQFAVCIPRSPKNRMHNHFIHVFNVLIVSLSLKLSVPPTVVQRERSYQFDRHVFVCIQVLSESQLPEVPTADFLSNAEVWSNHQDPGVGAGPPATVP